MGAAVTGATGAGKAAGAVVAVGGLAEALAAPPNIRVGGRSQARPSGVSPITTPTTKAAVTALIPARKRFTRPGNSGVGYHPVARGAEMTHAPRTRIKVNSNRAR